VAQYSSQPHGIDGLFTGIETVLVIEDELVVRQLIAETLQHQRYTILNAPNEAAAVEVIEGHSGLIDLLLTDMVCLSWEAKNWRKCTTSPTQTAEHFIRQAIPTLVYRIRVFWSRMAHSSTSPSLFQS
jgi:hypothetical protein